MTCLNCTAAVLGLLVLTATALQGQSRRPNLAGTWQVNTPDDPREVIIRPDSSASFGQERVRWRVIGNSIFLAFGDEWVGYFFKLSGTELTVSGGDLEEPMRLRRVGPPLPRPDSVPLPVAPPMQRLPTRQAGSRPPDR